jgi:hypothetical protein
VSLLTAFIGFMPHGTDQDKILDRQDVIESGRFRAILTLLWLTVHTTDTSVTLEPSGRAEVQHILASVGGERLRQRDTTGALMLNDHGHSLKSCKGR